MVGRNLLHPCIPRLHRLLRLSLTGFEVYNAVDVSKLPCCRECAVCRTSIFEVLIYKTKLMLVYVDAIVLSKLSHRFDVDGVRFVVFFAL